MSDFGPATGPRGLGRPLLAVRRRPPRGLRGQPAQQLRGADVRQDGRLPQGRAGRGGGRLVGPLMDDPAHPRRPLRRPARLRPPAAYAEVPDGDGGTLRMAYVDAGPADGAGRAAAARRADLVVPVPPRDRVLVDAGHARRRAGPGRVRPLGQAGPAGRPQLRPARRVGAGAGLRRARPARGDAGRPGLGRADRAAPGRRAPGPVRRAWSPRTPACPPATSRCRTSGGGSGARWSAPRSSTSAGWSRPGARTRWPTRSARRTTRRSPTRPSRRVRGSMPTLVPTSPGRPGDRGEPGRLGGAGALRPAVPGRLQRRRPDHRRDGAGAEPRGPGARGPTHPVLAGAGHFLQEDAGERLGGVVADLVRSLDG